MAADVSVLRDDLPNASILDFIRAGSSTDYQNRIPAADKAGVKETIATLMQPANRVWLNEFIDSLVNRIGMTIMRSNSWSNPLAAFKRGMLTFGSTIEEIQVGLLEAHNYNPDRDYMEQTLFGRETPEVQTNFHTVNRQDFYKVTINEALLRRAFLEEGGLGQFVNGLMEAPSNSDQLDEFLLTCSLFREYESHGGFYHIRVPDVNDMNSTRDDARMTLRKMRAAADNLKFLSTKYNAAKMPVFAKPEDLIILSSPEFNAAIDVEALAGAFNIDKAQMTGRTVIIPQEQFGITGCQAILTTKEFFVIADQLFESASQWNPANMHNNYFLHHWEIVSCSRFAPAIMFTNQNDDEIIVVSVRPTSVDVITIQPDSDGNVPAGIYHGGVMQLATSVEPAGADQGILWTVTGGGQGTYITQDGVLHLGALDPVAAAGTVTVHAFTTDVDPDLPAGTLTETASKAITVEDGPLTIWPVQGVLTGITVAGVAVPAFVAGTHAYDLTIPSGTIVSESNVFTKSVGPVSTDIEVTPNDAAPEYTVTVITQDGIGSAVVTYVISVTNT